jgi:TonB family protein
VQRESPAEAEKALLEILSSPWNYTAAMRRAQEDERLERVSAVETGPQVIEVMSDDDTSTGEQVRAPRPYRRLKPPYPEAAARAEVTATVDVLVDIDARGEVGRVEISRWAGYGLDQSVIETVKQMHFFPAQREGVAIPMRVLLRYNFRKPPPDSMPTNQQDDLRTPSRVSVSRKMNSPKRVTLALVPAYFAPCYYPF